MLSLLRDGPERAIAGARGPIKHAHSDLKRDHSFVARAARLIKDVLLDMAWDVLLDHACGNNTCLGPQLVRDGAQREPIGEIEALHGLRTNE